MDRLLASDDQLSRENDELHQQVLHLSSELEDTRIAMKNVEAQATLIRELQLESNRLEAQLSRVTAERNDLARDADRSRLETRSWRPEPGEHVKRASSVRQ